MATEHWLRWHHGTINDPKWRVVAMRASSALSRDVTVGHVLSVWCAMLECASQATPRGTLSDWDDEDVAAGLGYDDAMVRCIREAMQGKTLEGDELTGWKRRQPKAEDVTAADRKRAQRERERAASGEVTNRDNQITSQPVTECHDRGEERRGDISPSLRSGDGARARTTPPPCPTDVEDSTWRDWLALRKAKRAPVTETVLVQARREAGKAGLPLNRFLEIWCSRGSQGLQADWLRPNERDGPRPGAERPMGKQMQGIMALEDLKRGARERLAADRDCDGTAEACLPFAG